MKRSEREIHKGISAGCHHEIHAIPECRAKRRHNRHRFSEPYNCVKNSRNAQYSRRGKQRRVNREQPQKIRGISGASSEERKSRVKYVPSFERSGIAKITQVSGMMTSTGILPRTGAFSRIFFSGNFSRMISSPSTSPQMTKFSVPPCQSPVISHTINRFRIVPAVPHREPPSGI